MKRPRVVSVRRVDPYRLSIGDEALAEIGPGLLRLLNLQGGDGRKLGDAIAPEYTIPFSAASTAAVFVGNLKDRARPNMWSIVACHMEWIAPCREDESVFSTARIETLGRTSIVFAFDVFGGRTAELIARGRMTLVETGTGIPAPYTASVLKPDQAATQEIPASTAALAATAMEYKSPKAGIADHVLPAEISRRLKSIHWRYVYKQRWKDVPAIEWTVVPTSLPLNASAEVEVEIRNNGSLPEDLDLVMKTPAAFGLEFEWGCEPKFKLGKGQSCRLKGIVRALRPDEVNFGKPWALTCCLLSAQKELARITAEITVPGDPAGKLFYVLTEDCETFDGGERTGHYPHIDFMGNRNDFMDPEDYRIQMIEKPDALNRIAEQHGARFTHFWTATQRFAAEWAARNSTTGAWDKLSRELDESIRRGSRRHEYAPHIHFDFEPDSNLPPQPRLIYDRLTDGIIPNEYYDPIGNADHKYHGWDGSRKGIAYVKRDGSFGDGDSKTGSLRKSTRYLATHARGGQLCVTARTGACDFGSTAEDLGVSIRALEANGILANADAGLYEKVGWHPRGRQMYFCRKDDLESEIENIEDATVVQLRAPEVQIEGASLEELNAWFDRRVAASFGPGVRAIVAMTHAMFMKGAPDPYRDTTGGDFEKLDKHLEYVRTRYPRVQFATASQAVLEFIDYYTPALRAVVTRPILQSNDGSLSIYSIRILGQGIPVSRSRPMLVTVQAPPSIEPAEIKSLRILENGEPIASAELSRDRLPIVEFLAKDRTGYEMEIQTVQAPIATFCAPERGRFFSAQQARYEEAENDESFDLLRMERPTLLRKTVRDDARVNNGDSWDWLFPGDLFRFLVNPIAGNAEPIGRSTHPYSSHSLGAAVYVAKELFGPRFRPASAELSCMRPVTGLTNFRLECSVAEMTDEELILDNAIFEADSHIAQVRIVLVNRPNNDQPGGNPLQSV